MMPSPALEPAKKPTALDFKVPVSATAMPTWGAAALAKKATPPAIIRPALTSALPGIEVCNTSVTVPSWETGADD
jgi:hypothetical protein